MSSQRCLFASYMILQVSVGLGRASDERTAGHPAYDVGRPTALPLIPAAAFPGSQSPRKHSASHSQNEHQTCALLKNHGTHHTVELEVGTPGQKFNVIADTGSDAVIVPACACVMAGYCDNRTRCFKGTGRSSTFVVPCSGPPVVRMQFGSGPVQAVLASDVVRVGAVSTPMEKGVMLMTAHHLQFPGVFEGILGLGNPAGRNGNKGGFYQAWQPRKSEKREYAAVEADSRSAKVDGRKVDSSFDSKVTVHARVPPSVQSEHMRNTTNLNISVPGFMETAGIARFSLCFNDGSAGVMRLNTPPSLRPHGSIGQAHWGLGFYGISVGKYRSKVLFCNETKQLPKSPCGMIPDSGTTAILGPREQLDSLYEQLCDEWPRCSKNFTAMKSAAEKANQVAHDTFGYDPWGIEPASKIWIFQQLIGDCKSWMQKDRNLDELPSLYFHVGGSNGTKQTLKLNGWSYIIVRDAPNFEYVYKDVPGFGKIPWGKNFTGGTHLACSPAFDTMDYLTEDHGAVWLMGSPAFYEYQVGYDVQSNPPSISFHKCGGCGKCPEKTSLLDTNDAARMGKSDRCIEDTSLRFRPPRVVSGPWRTPTIDTTQPF